MSRSKNVYHGMSLGRVQRSEYDDANLRDLARHDARLGESLKTVERARNVMKKSMEADKQLFIKTGQQPPNKLFQPLQGSNSRPSIKVSPLTAQVSSGTKIKRTSVTDMPSDLDRSNGYRSRPAPRSKSYQELIIDTTAADTSRVKHGGSLDNKHQELSTITLGSGKSFIPDLIDSGVVSGSQAKCFDPVMTSRVSGLDMTGKSSSDLLTHKKTSSKVIESDKFIDSSIRSKESEQSIDADRKLNSQAILNDADEKVTDGNVINGKNKKADTVAGRDRELSSGKRPTIWEALSTPKYMSITKAKRNQIQMEFSPRRLKASKSSPVLFSPVKLVSSFSPASQGKVEAGAVGSLQGRHVEGSVKIKNSFGEMPRNST